MKFGAGQERRLIHEIEAIELDKWIAAQKIQKAGKDFGKPWGLSTKRTWMSLFSGLWECAIALDAATVNIVEKLEPIEKPTRIKKVYPNETTKQLLAAALENDATKKHLITLVLGFFGCMRPEEISSDKPKRKKLPKDKWFGWHNINLETGQIDVTVDVAKTGDERRHVNHPQRANGQRHRAVRAGAQSGRQHRHCGGDCHGLARRAAPSSLSDSSSDAV